MITETELIQAYRCLFNYRKSTETISNVEQLEARIKIELLDELTHPRVRKSMDEKLKIAYERIDNSTINKQEKLELKQIYDKVYNSVNTF